MNEPVRRVEHMQCPKCREILPIERDKENMSTLPKCGGCGYKVGLGDLFRQMRAVMPDERDTRD